MMFRPMPILTVLSVISLGILIMLGNWQWSRFTDKRGQAEAPEYVPETLTITPIAVEGGQAQLVYGIIEGLAVWRRYVPARDEADGETVLALSDVVVDITPQPRELSDTTPRTFEGVRFPTTPPPASLLRRDTPQDNVWRSRHGPALLANMGFEGAEVIEPVEITLVDPRLGERIVANPYAGPQLIDPLPPERHLGYALTWWGMAFALLGVYFGLHHAQGRLRLRGS